MNIKSLVIRVNDFICYAGFALICLASLLSGIGGGPLYGAAVGVIGLVVFSLMSGLWFVLSSIADNMQRQVMLIENQNALITKIYKQGQHNIEIQFPNE